MLDRSLVIWWWVWCFLFGNSSPFVMLDRSLIFRWWVWCHFVWNILLFGISSIDLLYSDGGFGCLLLGILCLLSCYITLIFRWWVSCFLFGNSSPFVKLSPISYIESEVIRVAWCCTLMLDLWAGSNVYCTHVYLCIFSPQLVVTPKSGSFA
jgi:hypothetical protein